MILDATQFQQLVREVMQALSSNSQGVGEVQVVDTLTGISSLPALRLLNGQESVVEVPLSLLSEVAEEGAALADEATQNAIVATVRAEEATDLAHAARNDLEEIKEVVSLATSESLSQTAKSKEVSASTEEIRLATLNAFSDLQDKLAAAVVVISDSHAGVEELKEFQKKADEALFVIVNTTEEARNVVETLVVLRKQVSDVINEALDVIDQGRLTINEAKVYADLALKAALWVNEIGNETIISAANADSAASHATEQSLRARESSAKADEATENANDTANHPTIVGEDNYVYIWNKATKAYDKTDIYVRGEGFKVSRVFASIDEMNAYDGTDLKEGDFVLINTGSVEDENTAELYVRNPAGSAETWRFLVDMSGAIGFTGKTPQISIGTTTTSDSNTPASASLTGAGVDADGNPIYKLSFSIPKGNPLLYSDLTPEQIAELQRPAADAIESINQTNNNIGVAEQARVAEEERRKSAEDGRDLAEAGRSLAETERAAAELLRVHAEAGREEVVAEVVGRTEVAIDNTEAATADCRKAIEELAAGGGGGGGADTTEIVAALTVVVDSYKDDFDAKVGDLTVVLDDINDDTEVAAASSLLDDINGEVI